MTAPRAARGDCAAVPSGVMGFFLLILAIAVIAIAGIAFFATRGKHTTPDETWDTPDKG